MRARVAIATLTGLLVLAGAGLLGRHFASDLPFRLPVGSSCTVTGTVAGSTTASAPGSGGGSADNDRGSASQPIEVTVDPAQLANAATISAVGIRRGVPPRAVVIALATAMQESKLENLPGGDRDSIGLFQQRPSKGWGRPDQVGDPRYAANAFYTALLKVRRWEGMRLTDAAQAVQRSAYPEAYEQWSAKASVLADALTGAAPGTVTCTNASRPPTRGPAAAQALASDLQLDWGQVGTVPTNDPPGLAVAVGAPRTGWQYAHWLVAHAERHGVTRVRFADREWTARRASWDRVANPTPDTVERVLAEVHRG